MAKEKTNKTLKTNTKALKNSNKETPSKKGASFKSEKNKTLKATVKKETTKTKKVSSNVAPKTATTNKTIKKPSTSTKPLVKKTIDRKELSKRLKETAAVSNRLNETKTEVPLSVKKNSTKKQVAKKAVVKKEDIKKLKQAAVKARIKAIKEKDVPSKALKNKTDLKKPEARINKAALRNKVEGKAVLKKKVQIRSRQKAKKVDDKKVTVDTKNLIAEIPTFSNKTTKKTSTQKAVEEKRTVLLIDVKPVKEKKLKQGKTTSKKKIEELPSKEAKEKVVLKASTKEALSNGQENIIPIYIEKIKIFLKVFFSFFLNKRNDEEKDEIESREESQENKTLLEYIKQFFSKFIRVKTKDKEEIDEVYPPKFDSVYDAIEYESALIISLMDPSMKPDPIIDEVEINEKLADKKSLITIIKEFFAKIFKFKNKESNLIEVEEIDEVYPPKFDSVYDAIEYETNLIISLMEPSMKPEPIIEEDESEKVVATEEKKSLSTLIREFFAKIFKFKNKKSNSIEVEEIDEVYPPKFDSVYDAIEYETALIISLMDPSMKPEPIIEEEESEVVEVVKIKKSLLTIIKEFFIKLFGLRKVISNQIEVEETDKVYPPKFDSVYDAIEYESALIISLMDPSMKPDPIIDEVEEEAENTEELIQVEDKKTLFESIKLFFNKFITSKVEVLEDTQIEDTSVESKEDKEVLVEEIKAEEGVIETKPALEESFVEEIEEVLEDASEDVHEEVTDELIVEEFKNDNRRENVFFRIVKEYYKAALFGILLGLLVFDLVLRFVPKETTKYKFSEINSSYVEKEYTLEVPSDWTFFDDYPGFLVKEKKKLEFKMSFSAGQMDDATFTNMLEELESTYEIKTDKVNNIDVYGFMYEAEGSKKHSSYIAYFDGVCVIMNIQNEDYSKGLDIIATIK